MCKEGKKYIGVDLGAWFGNKTSIAICKLEDDKLRLEKIEKEEKFVNKNNIVDQTQLFKRNQNLVSKLIEHEENDTIIGIDAPFSIPYCLSASTDLKKEEASIKNIYSSEYIKGELTNCYLFDNSARFVYEKTNQIPLAPAGDKIGRLTARMIHIRKCEEQNNRLNIIRNTELDKNKKNIATVEVFPSATIFKLAKAQNSLKEYFKTIDNTEEFDKSKKLNIESYKGKNFKVNQKRMLDLIKKYFHNFDENIKIETDDDYDAIICALTVYLVDKHGYEKPNDSELELFTNSFIYMPKLDEVRE